MTGTDREPTAPEIRGGSPSTVFSATRSRDLEVEQELRLGRGRLEQLREPEAPAPRRRELPAVPEDRERADGSQVPYLETPEMEADVRFDELDAEQLGGAQVRDAVPRAMRDEERLYAARERAEDMLTGHAGRV